MANFKMNPNFERDLQRDLVKSMNEAVRAVGPARGRTAASVKAALKREFQRRNLPPNDSLLDPAVTAIAAGDRFTYK